MDLNRERSIRNRSERSFPVRIIQNYLLVWLDEDIDDRNIDQSINQLKTIVNTVELFDDTDQSIDFITDVKQEQVLMILSDQLAPNLLPLIHNINQINSIYIYSTNKSRNEQKTTKWKKLKGIFNDIPSLCQMIGEDAKKYDHDSISISFVSLNNSKESEQNLDQLDSTFMYTQILKEILLSINYNEQHIKDFTNYYRENFIDNPSQLNSIEEFEKNYGDHCPIWWYTHQYSFYSILNRALRTFEVDTIIQMGFFIQDIHRQILKLHSQQFLKLNRLDKFLIYRGQSLSKKDFNQIMKIQGGLISFNNFLSTTKDLSIAFRFAQRSIDNDLSNIGIVFVITIDPSIKSTPFASIDDLSFFNKEEEILFSMHTIFRIDHIIQSNEDPRIWQIDLIQTKDNDQQLNRLTQTIRDDIHGSNQWDRLANILVKLGKYDKADQLYLVLLQRAKNDREKIHLCHQLGWSKKNQKLYEEAIQFYEESIRIKQKSLPADHHSFTSSYNDLGSIYEKMNKYLKALLYYEKALDIQQSNPSSDQIGLASCYSKIGSIYEKINQYPQALQFHLNALQIRKKLLPLNSSNLAYCYQNLASVYEKMDNYSEALQSHEQAIQIQQEALPENHPDIAQCYHSLGIFHGKQGQYSKAHQCHEKACQIGRRSLPPNHPNLIKWNKSLQYIQRKRR